MVVRTALRSVGGRDCLTVALAASMRRPKVANAKLPTSSRLYSLSTTSVGVYGPKRGDKIKVAMSGGVDSSVTALLLAQSGLYDLEAVFMRNWNELDEQGSMQPGSGGATGCTWQQDWDDVQRTCHQLGNLPVSMVDLSREYWTDVFEPALADWQSGTTPNPDVDCNREIKFGALMERLVDDTRSSSGQKTWLATGHYAQIGASTAAQERARPMLLRAQDRTKDQSYYLSAVPESRLAHAHFPLAPLQKTQVRALAVQHDLPSATRKESMGICFVGERGHNSTNGFSSFLTSYLNCTPGEIVDEEGVVVGQHQGLHTFTLGQGARIKGALARYYVAQKDPQTNRIMVVQGTNHPRLLCASLAVSKFEWIWGQAPAEIESVQGAKLLAQVRHRQTEVECTVWASVHGGCRVEFSEPVLAVAPGQVLGLWKDQWCLGSGTISQITTQHDTQQSC